MPQTRLPDPEKVMKAVVKRIGIGPQKSLGPVGFLFFDQLAS